jgi:hypothetical protein
MDRQRVGGAEQRSMTLWSSVGEHVDAGLVGAGQDLVGIAALVEVELAHVREHAPELGLHAGGGVAAAAPG